MPAPAGARAGACPASPSIAVANAGSTGALGALVTLPAGIRAWGEFRSSSRGPSRGVGSAEPLVSEFRLPRPVRRHPISIQCRCSSTIHRNRRVITFCRHSEGRVESVEYRLHLGCRRSCMRLDPTDGTFTEASTMSEPHTAGPVADNVHNRPYRLARKSVGTSTR